MESYALISQDTVVNYITVRPIMDLCDKLVWMPGTWVAKGWWYQEVTDLVRSRESVAAAEEGEAEEAYLLVEVL